MAEQDSRLTQLYRKLQGSLIRTVQLLPGSAEDPIRCVLKEVNLTPHNKSLNYQALSYVWGDPADTVTILVNEHEFQATRNLGNALRQFRQAGEAFVEQEIWIDAICINQRDIDEKSKQVPRMADIYSMATRVVIWLGPNNPEEEQVFARGFWCRARLHELYVRDIAGTDMSFDEWNYEKTYPELANAEDETRDIWAIISRRQWFKRIWTVQEFCLAGDSSIFYAGAHSITVGALKLWGGSGLAAFNSGRKSTEMRTMFGRRMWFQDQLPLAATQNGETYNAVSSLLELIVRTGCVATSVPHDRIYGLLALATLVHQDLPEDLEPNYLRSYKSVYTTYARFIIGWTGDLRILLCGRNDLRGVPSWVPDFRYLGMIHTLEKPETLATPFFADNWNQLTVQGSVVGSCIKYVPPWHPAIGSHSRTEAELDLDAKQYFETVITSLVHESAKLRNQSFGSTLSEFVEARAGAAEDLAWFLNQESLDTGYKEYPQNNSTTIKAAMTWGKILLEDGIILDFVRQDASVEPGDIVCMLKGSNLPAVLRPKGDVHELVGGCLASFSRNYNSFIGGTRKVVQFTLA
ncbi:heterokaryon incompatibility protein-domain-containing protein [Xylariaceae sp. AK1471]|nr:heterokaryon incompatibility protein-domain-containing protein [Xylariaceae sp. AK1471]